MPEFTHRVTRVEFYTAHKMFDQLFNEYWYGQNDFFKFIGFNDFAGDYDTVFCSELAHRKIEILNSPHAYALMKAFIARTGYHKKLAER